MTKKQILYMYIAAMSVTTIIFIMSAGMSFKRADISAEAAKESSADISSEISAGYILGEYEGKLALYRSGSSRPYKKLSYDISMLTEYDREQVINGIYAENEAELNRLIEDLTS